MLIALQANDRGASNVRIAFTSCCGWFAGRCYGKATPSMPYESAARKTFSCRQRSAYQHAKRTQSVSQVLTSNKHEVGCIQVGHDNIAQRYCLAAAKVDDRFVVLLSRRVHSGLGGYAKRWRAARSTGVANAFVPLVFAPGEA